MELPMQLTKSLLVLLALVGTAVWADDAKKKAPPTLSTEEQDFYWKAAAGGLFEVEAAKLAIHHAGNPDVKTLAAELLKDHQKASQELTAIGEAKGMSTPAHLTKEQNESLEKLKGATGATFDKTYVDLMVEDHPKDISLFEKESESGKDSQLKAFAKEKLPALKRHLEHAKSLQQKTRK
jgi:putative membrane protein